MASYRQLYRYTVSLNKQILAKRSTLAAANAIASANPGSTVTQTKTKIQAIVRKKGHKPVRATFPNKGQAETWAKRQDALLTLGQFKAVHVNNSITIAVLLDWYELDFTAHKSSAKNEKKSLKNIRRLLGHRLVPINGHRDGELTSRDVRDYVETRLDEGVVSDTIRKELNPLSNCLNVAGQQWEDKIPDLINVVQNAKKVLQQSRTLIAGEKRDRRIWQGEIEAILAGAKSQLCCAAFIVAFNTGMRRSELAQCTAFEVTYQIKFADSRAPVKTQSVLKLKELQKLNPDATVKMLRKTLNRYLDLDNRSLYLPADITKTKRERFVHLTDEAIEVLRDLPSSMDGRLFPVAPDTLTNWLNRRVKSNSIEDLRFHDARHEALSRFAEMRWPIDRIAQVSGHGSYDMLMRYVHPSRLAMRRDPVTGRVIDDKEPTAALRKVSPIK
jgi:integrase